MELEKADTSSSRPRFIGLCIVGVVFGIFGIWALVAPLKSAALATGMVEVKGNRKVVQHLEGGIVKEIHAKDGDRVEEGQLLIRLDDTQLRAQLEINNVQYLSALALKARLVAERDELEAVDFPEVLLQSTDPRASEFMQSQNQVFRTRRQALLGEISVLEQRIEQLQAQIQGTRELKKGNAVSYTQLTLPTIPFECRSRWSPYQ